MRVLATLPVSGGRVLGTAPTTAPAADTYGASFPASTSDTPITAGLKATGNLPSSFVNFVKGLATAVLHPVNTVESTGAAIAGGASELGRKLGTGANVGKPATPEEETFHALVSAFKSRYGTPEDAQRSATNDPFGVGADIVGILSAGAGLAGKTEELNNLASKTASVVTKPASAVGRASGTFTAQVLGATTGKGASTIRAAARGSDAFTAAMRGQISPEHVVQSVQDAVQTIADNRRNTYTQDLAAIGKNTKSLDISPVTSELHSQLGKFGIAIDDDGSLNFDRSSIANNGTARADVQGVYDTLKKWGTLPGDRTPIGLDTLKKQLTDFYSPSGSARAFVQAVKGRVTNILKTQVPGYSDMTAKYGTASDLLDEIKSATGAGPNAKVDTVFTKLTTAMRADKELRLEVLGQMQTGAGDPTIMDKIAGINMSSAIPGGLVGRGVDIGAIYTLAHSFSPTAMAALLATSPRVVGEFVRALGLGSQKTAVLLHAVDKLAPFMAKIGPASTLREALPRKSQQSPDL